MLARSHPAVLPHPWMMTYAGDSATFFDVLADRVIRMSRATGFVGQQGARSAV